MGPKETETLATYRRVLPTREYIALDAWVGSFWDFQIPWLLEQRRNAIMCKGRQIGMSHTTSAVGVLWGAFHGETTTVISIGQSESDEVLDKARRHSQVIQALGSRFARLKTDNATELEFESGGRIISLPSSGGRGYTGNIFLDEFAYQERADKVWEAAGSVTLLGNARIRISSTPNGIGNTYHQLWKRALASDRWACHEVTTSVAIKEGYPVDEKECWERAKGDPRLFDQLYNCSFLDSELQYIPSELFVACFSENWPILTGGQVYAGLDIGETRDRTVLVVVRRKGNRRQLLHMETHAKTDDALLDELVRKAIKDFGASLVCADSTGLGRFPAQRMAERWGRRFEGVDFTLKSKEDLATTLYDCVARKELELPNAYTFEGIDEMPLLREDVYAIRREVTSAGNVRYVAARSEKGHADRAWALMLSLHAAGSMSPMFAALQS